MESFNTEMTLNNRRGLHLRFAGLVSKAAREFVSDIRIGKGNRLVDAKSPLALVSLAASRGALLSVRIEGPDADNAGKVIAEFLSREED